MQVHIRTIESEDVWYVDSGCSKHMIRRKVCLEDFKKVDDPKVIFGGNDEPRRPRELAPSRRMDWRSRKSHMSKDLSSIF